MLTLTGTTACSDYLDKEPDTELDLSMVFTNRDKVYSMLAYVYNVIHNPDKYALISDGYEVFADDLTPLGALATVGLEHSDTQNFR